MAGAITLPFLLLLAACFTLTACFPSVEETNKENKQEPKPPNVILILTDDLALEDVNVDTLKHMPNLRALMEKGTTFDNAFVSNSLCCPSRATTLRGQYTHNHQILHNQPPLPDDGLPLSSGLSRASSGQQLEPDDNKPLTYAGYSDCRRVRRVVMSRGKRFESARRLSFSYE
jgi:hypothetical protein